MFDWPQDNLGVLDGSALLELRFGEDSGSVLCSLAIATGGVVRPLEHFKAVFMVAIRESSGALPAPPAQPTPTPAPASSATARRPQPRQGSKRRAVEATTEEQWNRIFRDKMISNYTVSVLSYSTLDSRCAECLNLLKQWTILVQGFKILKPQYLLWSLCELFMILHQRSGS